MFSEDEKPFSEAREACRAIAGYDLVSVMSTDLATFLKPHVDHWIGLSDIDNEGAYVWVNGHPSEWLLGYEPWNSGEPNVRYCFIQIVNF